MAKALAAGPMGCISATANINAAAIAQLIDRWQQPDAEQHQAALNAVRKAVDTYDRIAAIKAVLAVRYRDKAWMNVRPPLTRIESAARSALLSDPAIVALLQAAES